MQFLYQILSPVLDTGADKLSTLSPSRVTAHLPETSMFTPFTHFNHPSLSNSLNKIEISDVINDVIVWFKEIFMKSAVWRSQNKHTTLIAGRFCCINLPKTKDICRKLGLYPALTLVRTQANCLHYEQFVIRHCPSPALRTRMEGGTKLAKNRQWDIFLTFKTKRLKVFRRYDV